MLEPEHGSGAVSVTAAGQQPKHQDLQPEQQQQQLEEQTEMQKEQSQHPQQEQQLVTAGAVSGSIAKPARTPGSSKAAEGVLVATAVAAPPSPHQDGRGVMQGATADLPAKTTSLLSQPPGTIVAAAATLAAAETSRRASSSPGNARARVTATNGSSSSGGTPAQVVLLLVGVPGSGKSTFCKGLEQQSCLPWVRVNQDSIKKGKGTRDACIKLARKSLQEGKWVVVDR